MRRYGSKADGITRFLNREVENVLAAVAFDYPQHAEALRALRSEIVTSLSWNVTSDPYRLKELDDIMHWKASPRT